MEDSQRKLNDAISNMAGTLHRDYLRRIYVRESISAVVCALRSHCAG